MRPFMRALLIVSTIAALNACKKPEYYDITAPSFRNSPTINLDVAEIRTVDNVQTTPGKHIENEFPTSPRQALDIWVKDRLRASGTENVLDVLVYQAEATQQDLPLKKGLKGAFTKEPSERYDTVLEVELRVYTPDSNISQAAVRSRATISRELLEGSGPERRKELFAQMVRDLINQLDNSLEQRISENFTRFIKYN